MTVPARARWVHLKGHNPHLVEGAGLTEPDVTRRVAVADADRRDEATSTQRLVRSSAVVGLGTALSRVTGLLRTIALAYALGATAVAEGYNLANTTPNMVYDLLLGGILSATLVPVFVDRFDNEDDDGVSAIMSVAAVCLVALTVAAVIAAPLIFKLYTWQKHGTDAAEASRIGVPLLRFFLPQIFFYGLTALGTALLNARRRFAAPAFAPVLNNLVVIAVLVAFARVAGRSPSVGSVTGSSGQLWLLGLGTTVGIVVMAVTLGPAVRAAGMRLRWRPRLRDPAVRKVASLSGWTFGYVLANQVALVVSLALAGREPGGVSWYTYAFIFFQLPYGLFAVSVMTTVTPDLSAAASAGDQSSFRERFALGGRLMTLVVLPSSIGMVVLARPLVNVLLGRGSFTAADATGTAQTLAWFAAGLVFFSLYLFALRGFYALHDTKTPFLINLGENALNIVLAFALVGRYGVPGLAAAYSVSYLVACVVALGALRHRAGGLGGRALLAPIARMVAGGVAMGAVIVGVGHTIGGSTGVGGIVRISVSVVLGAAVYFGAAFVLRIDDVRAGANRLARR
ncbi:MAG: murein biosynthesis integral membrane protein MurJ [Acidimicrobiales bacterium]